MFHLTFTTLMFTLAVAKSSAKFSHTSVFRAADKNLINFMLSSHALQQDNPTRSVSCFDYYMPLLNGVTDEYERAYGACLSSAEQRRQAVDSSTKPQREDIEGEAAGACNALKTCNDNSGSIQYFECYANAGAQNTKVMYGIEQNSTSILVAIREEYRLIENDQNRCTSVAERAYVEGTSSTYEELQGCLQGKTPVPITTTSTTSAPTTVSVTTLEPETTTGTSTSVSTTTSQPEVETTTGTTTVLPEPTTTSVPSESA